MLAYGFRLSPLVSNVIRFLFVSSLCLGRFAGRLHKSFLSLSLSLTHSPLKVVISIGAPSSGALLPAGAAQLGQLLVVGRIDEARVRVAMHQRVDLQLGLVERVRRRVHHVAVDDLAHSRVQADLWVDKKGNDDEHQTGERQPNIATSSSSNFGKGQRVAKQFRALCSLSLLLLISFTQLRVYAPLCAKHRDHPPLSFVSLFSQTLLLLLLLLLMLFSLSAKSIKQHNPIIDPCCYLLLPLYTRLFSLSLLFLLRVRLSREMAVPAADRPTPRNEKMENEIPRSRNIW